MSVSTTPAPVTVKANLWQSMILGGAAASFAVNFTHPIVRNHFTFYRIMSRILLTTSVVFFQTIK